MIIGISLNSLQTLFLVPKEYIFWVIDSSVPNFIIIIPTILVYILFYYYFQKKSGFESRIFQNIIMFFRRNKLRGAIMALSIFILIGYYMLFNISIITEESIINYSFFKPHGKVYMYSDIKTIRTGTFNITIPFIRNKGDFYYVLELNDGEEIDLVNVADVKDDPDNDMYKAIIEFDKVLIDKGISKKVDAKYLHIYLRGMDKVYADRIKYIIQNIN